MHHPLGFMFLIQLGHDPILISQAYVDMIEALNWKTFVVLYEDSDGLVRLQEVLKLSSIYSDWQITVRQLLPGTDGDYRLVSIRDECVGSGRSMMTSSLVNILENQDMLPAKLFKRERALLALLGE